MVKRVLLCQLDGSLPNIALMRISAHHRALGDEVEMCHGAAFERTLFSSNEPDTVYASAIFRKTIPLAERLRHRYPNAILGGTGIDPAAGETFESWEHRRKSLRDFGARPYPMPAVRTKELIGFQRFVIGAYDKRFTWAEFVEADYRPEKLGKDAHAESLFPSMEASA